MHLHRSPRRPRLIGASLVASIVALSAAQSTVTAQSPAAASPPPAPTCATPGGDLIMARDLEANSLVPWLSTGNQNIFLQEQIYDQLVMQLPGYTDPQPGLAETWDV
jgi:ABC-type transport system substrate-binding protein